MLINISYTSTDRTVFLFVEQFKPEQIRTCVKNFNQKILSK